MPSFNSDGSCAPPLSLLGLAVPALSSPLVRRDDSNKPRDGRAEVGCERMGKAEVVDIVSIMPGGSLERLRAGNGPDMPDEDAMTDTADVAVVALSEKVSSLSGGVLAGHRS